MGRKSPPSSLVVVALPLPLLFLLLFLCRPRLLGPSLGASGVGQAGISQERAMRQNDNTIRHGAGDRRPVRYPLACEPASQPEGALGGDFLLVD